MAVLLGLVLYFFVGEALLAVADQSYGHALQPAAQARGNPLKGVP